MIELICKKFVRFFFWDEECVPVRINANLRSKIRDGKKCNYYSACLSTCKTRYFFQIKIKNVPMKKKKKFVANGLALFAK